MRQAVTGKLYEQSGIGRELADWRLDNHLEIKQITTCDRSGSWGWYLKG